MPRKPFEPKDPKLTETDAIAEAESIEEAPVKQALTVNGQPISDEVARVLPYALTDQGIEEKKRGKLMGTPGVSVISDAWDKSVQRKADAEVWDSYDPLKEGLDPVREPGMRYRYLSDRLAKRRGSRGWEPVADKDGRAITVGGMTLARMPEEAAERRNAHYQALSNEQLQNAAEQYQHDQTRAIRDSGLKGLAPLAVGERVTDSHQHPGMVTEVGVHSQRGQRAA